MPKEDTIRKQKTICEVDEDDGIYEKKIYGSMWKKRQECNANNSIIDK